MAPHWASRRQPQALSALTILALSWCAPSTSSAFEYLEHSYFGDLGCREAQIRLAPAVAKAEPDDPLVARYIALSLFCPVDWTKPYCVDGYKQAEAEINLLANPPAVSHDYAATLGDYAALADHLSAYGPLKGYPRAGAEGLVADTLRWMAAEPDGGADGVVADVAEDACETSVPVSWDAVAADVTAGLRTLGRRGLDVWPDEVLLPSRRSPVPLGPRDPTTTYSFDNPHYLDLILRNHHHFGQAGYTTWLGFHTVAWDAASRSCEAVSGLDADQLEDVADALGGGEDVDWDELTEAERAKQGCALLRQVVVHRVLHWAKAAGPEVVAPVARVLAGLDPGTVESRPEMRELADRVTVATMAMVVEGVGMHFLHDNLAGGHVRTDRTARGMGESRYDHDEDSRLGVLELYSTAAGSVPFVGFGDGFLLGPALPNSKCEHLEREGTDPAVVAGCLRRSQRTLMVAAGAASLMDWALGGVMYNRADGECAGLDTPAGFVCRILPLRSSNEPGRGAPAAVALAHGTLPLPPPPFGYQSVLFGVGADALGNEVQAAVRVVFLSELDDMANWMTSYNFGLVSAFGRDRVGLSGEFSYEFHWRWAARFLINGGPFLFAGLRGFDGHNRFRTGVGPTVGFSMLPEGWIKLPLQIDVSYRIPVVIVNTGSDGFMGGFGPAGHMIEIAMGLAYF